MAQMTAKEALDGRQRKLVLAVAEYWRNWSKWPCLQELESLAHIHYITILKDSEDLGNNGWVKCYREVSERGGFRIVMKLTPRAEKVVPRLRELA